MKRITPFFFLCLISFTTLANGRKYFVASERLSQIPAISAQYVADSAGSSNANYNYNSAFVPSGGRSPAGLLVRTQNRTSSTNPYLVGPSKIAFSAKSPTSAHGLPFSFNTIRGSNIVLEPSTSEDALGTEDPRVAYDPSSGLYFVFYTAVSHNASTGATVARLALATTPDPRNASAWTKHGAVFPSLSWSKSGALLIRPNKPKPPLPSSKKLETGEPGIDSSATTSYLFWGDSSLVAGLQVATTQDLLRYSYQPKVWLPTRANFFDSHLVEAGPPPLPLSDGNFLFIYNSARTGYPSKKPGYDLQYNVGFVILDRTDPTKILQRSEVPLLSPVEPWEIGVSGELSLTPNVVFCEGMEPLPGDPAQPHVDRFLLYYGAADSVVGVAEVTVLSID